MESLFDIAAQVLSDNEYLIDMSKFDVKLIRRFVRRYTSIRRITVNINEFLGLLHFMYKPPLGFDIWYSVYEEHCGVLHKNKYKINKRYLQGLGLYEQNTEVESSGTDKYVGKYGEKYVFIHPECFTQKLCFNYSSEIMGIIRHLMCTSGAKHRIYNIVRHKHMTPICNPLQNVSLQSKCITILVKNPQMIKMNLPTDVILSIKKALIWYLDNPSTRAIVMRRQNLIPILLMEHPELASITVDSTFVIKNRYMSSIPLGISDTALKSIGIRKINVRASPSIMRDKYYKTLLVLDLDNNVIVGLDAPTEEDTSDINIAIKATPYALYLQRKYQYLSGCPIMSSVIELPHRYIMSKK